MPQASQDLRDKFPGHDVEAWEALKPNFVDKAGVLSKKDKAYRPTASEWEAVDYLCDEWDYFYEELA